MTGDDKEALKEFLRGAAFVAMVIGVVILGIATISTSDDVPDPKQSTAVVGTYEGCDIIQWQYGPLAEYKYFLYCEDK